MNGSELIEARNDAACRANVNGFYGPGAMLGWYLTFAGCMVSWTLHPERKKKDSIDVDMLTFLMLPVTAAAQVILLSRFVSETYITTRTDSAGFLESLNRELASLCSCQRRYSIEAPAKAVFAYINLTIVLLYPLAAAHRRKRGTAILMVAIACLASEYYMHNVALEKALGLTLPSSFLNSRYSWAPFVPYLVGFDLSDYLWSWTSSRRSKNKEQLGNPSMLESQSPRVHEVDTRPTWGRRLAMGGWAVAGYFLRDANVPWLGSPTLHFWKVDWISLLFPDSPYSMSNIEQATAAVSGAIVLAFNLYSAGTSLYREGKKEKAKRRKKEEDTAAMELERLWYGQEPRKAHKKD